MKRGAFILAFLLITSSILGVVSAENWITGKATDQAMNMNISILTPIASISLFSPINSTYLNNNSILINYSSQFASNLWYSTDNLNNFTINSRTYINLSEGSHTLYIYANNSRGINFSSVGFSINSSRLTILYSEYENSTKGSSTDFSSYNLDQLQNLSEVIFEEVEYGKIKFNKEINVTDDSNPADNLIDFDSNVNISYNRIEIISSVLRNLNKPATLTLYNLGFSNPRILKDNVVCSDCIKESYSSGNLRFNVSSFSVYSSEETPIASVQVSSGGSGGGGGSGNVVKSFGTDLENIKITLKQGEVKKQVLSIENTGNKKTTFYLTSDKISRFLKIEQDEVELESGESKQITLDFFSDISVAPDLYLGKIIIDNGVARKEILVSIEVVSSNALFDVEISIPEKFKIAEPGGILLATISLSSKGRAGRVDATMEYYIKDESGKVVLASANTLAVDTQLGFVKEFSIPETLSSGRYILYVKAVYEGQIASASAWFDIGNKPLRTAEIIIYLVIGFIMILLLFILYALAKMKKSIENQNLINDKILIKNKLVTMKGGK